MGLYIQYGCGFTAPSNWVNYDSSPTLRFERIPFLGSLYLKNNMRFPGNVIYGDIVSGLPESSDSCDGVYCSHVLEHLAYHDFKKALRNTYKILKPGGIFRCVVPDLKFLINQYIQNYEITDNPASALMRSSMLGIENRHKGIFGFIKDFAGNSKHLWMWDEKSLIKELEETGFKNCRPCKFNDSKDLNFLTVEETDRFNAAVAIECNK